mmetsp:Transcript_18839/g.16755  ORF Transcript_18839/g.16755 Transcript_18839/m.16755 type:complete len:219 (+) Transcript_18839:18-674(+)|eukprot:CAMPEP_0201570652 /NCGR_PEP_ID=MMETSP0190_2-20130828/13001_1 /ASSEMBLY_ACC=CAM_ASM_000263 /TAXON_ID=37353 /ORGANISM="Rosalina sp." /LENGTH=218 /DNA_ID=CAMNT_0047994403 /DNA_START=24 /DNA_END=680 /DNA_ORIENTATION=-
MASEEDSAIWKSYREKNGSGPKNASQLMKWTKANEHVRTLSFSQAKGIFAIKSKEPEPEDDIKDQGPPRPKVDMTAEKDELKEYISECKEELVSLQNRELSMEDDYEEGNEGLETQFEELETLLKKAKEDVQTHRQSKYETIQTGVKNQKQVLEETLRILRKTLSECDIKGDKEEVKKVLSSIPQLEEIDEYQFEPINIDAPKKALEALVQSANSDDK